QRVVGLGDLLLRLCELCASVVEGALDRLELSQGRDASRIQLTPLVDQRRRTLHVLHVEAEDTLQGLTVVTGRLDHIPYGAAGVGFDRSHRLSCGYRADQKDGGGQDSIRAQPTSHGFTSPICSTRAGRMGGARTSPPSVGSMSSGTTQANVKGRRPTSHQNAATLPGYRRPVN